MGEGERSGVGGVSKLTSIIFKDDNLVELQAAKDYIAKVLKTVSSARILDWRVLPIASLPGYSQIHVDVSL